MILPDTAIWADHLRRADPILSTLLDGGGALMHPYVVGELAMGHLPDRAETLATLHELPRAEVAFPSEVLAFVEAHALAGTGIGYVDAHLLASTRLTPGARLWTRDRRLAAQAARLGLAADPAPR